MIPWPEKISSREHPAAEPVETPSARALEDSGPPVELDTRAPDDSAAPALPPAAPLVTGLSRRRHITSLSLFAALFLSAAVHAAVIALFGDRINRPGIDAAEDAVSVEIVLEGQYAALAGSLESTQSEGSSQHTESEPHNEVQQDTEEQPADEEQQEAPKEEHEETALSELPAKEGADEEAASTSEEAPSPEDSEPGEAPRFSAEKEQEQPLEPKETEPLPEAAEPVPADKPSIKTSPEMENSEPGTPETSAEPSKEELALDATAIEKAPEQVASVQLPEENIPFPMPRPEPPQQSKPAKTKRTAAATPRQEPVGRPARSTPAKPPQGRKAQEKTAASKKPSGQQSAAASASRQGGAKAGEKAAYARKLVAHVERHKRYPREAARQNIAGAASLAITIDRQGRLADASLSKRSGHAILDEEALAVARRAAPYPRPPKGVGGATVVFSVTLRFSP